MKNLRISLVFVQVMLVALLTSCGSFSGADSDITTIGVNKNGTVVGVIVEDFSASYYDKDELKNTIASEISDYNSSNGDNLVKLNKISEKDGNIKVIMSYDSSTDFAHFNEESFYYGTVDDASNGGFSLPGNMVDTDGNAVDSTSLDSVGSNHIIVTADDADIETPYDILYVSDGVSISDKKSASVSESEDDLRYIVLSK